MADDELRRVSPGIAVKVGRKGNLGGTAGIVLVPLWDGGLFLFSLLIRLHVLEVVGPYLDLMKKMVCMAINLAVGRINAIDVEYNGENSEVDTTILTTTVIKGLLNSTLTKNVNYVNAPGIAKSRD